MKKYIALITISISLSLHTCIVTGAAEQSTLEYDPEQALPAENYLSAPAQSCNLLIETPLTKKLTTILTDFCPGIINLIKCYAKNLWREQTIKTDKSVSSLAISPDGNTIAAGLINGFLKLFNPETGKKVLSWRGHKEGILSLDFSPDGSLLASGSFDKTAKIWNINTGKFKQSLDHENIVSEVKFLSDRLLSLSYNIIQLWNIETGQKIKSLPLPSICPLIAISDDRQLLATTTQFRESLIQIWNAHTLESIRTIPIIVENPTIPINISSIVLSPTNTQLAIGVYEQYPSKKRFIKLINLDTSELQQTLGEHENMIQALAYSQTGLLTSSLADENIYIWNLHNNQRYDQPCKILDKHQNSPSCSCLAFSPNGQYLVSGSYDKTIRISDMTEKFEEEKKK